MTPILYESSEQSFTSLGLGSLADAISCNVHTVLNGQFELEMTYPVSGLRYSDLKISRIIKAQAEKNGSDQLFDIYAISRPINGIVTVYASHVSGRKQFIPVMPCSASTIQLALSAISSHVAETNPFTLWSDKTTSASFNLKVPVSLGQALGGMQGSLLDVYGGEYEFDNFEIKLWNHRGQDNGVTLRYGKNITSIEQEESIASTITGVCPYWADIDGNVVTLTEKTVDSPNASNFPFKRTVTKDFSMAFDEAPTEAQLRAYTQSYIASNDIGVPSVGIDVSYENLADYEEFKDITLFEQVRLGDTVHVYFEPLEITANARVTETIYDTILEKYKKIRIGSVKAKLSTVINDVSNEITQEIEENSNFLEKAFNGAIDILSGADGGNIIINRNPTTGKPYEILIMDTDNASTAQKVLRLNMNGLGLSTNGINGPYTAAITGEGIVATVINTGVLNAALIKAGILQSENGDFYVDMTTGAATLSDVTLDGGSINLGNGVFKVTSAGALTATSASITGSITGSTISGSTFSAGRYITIYKADYSSSDATRLQNILLGTVTPTAADYEKLDLNKDNKLDVLDVAYLSTLLNGSASSITINATVAIDVDAYTDEVIKVGGQTKIGIQTVKTNTIEANNIKEFGYLASSDLASDGVSKGFVYNQRDLRIDGSSAWAGIMFGDNTNGAIRFRNYNGSTANKIQIAWKRVPWTGAIDQAWGSSVYESSSYIYLGTWYLPFSSTPAVTYGCHSSNGKTAWVASGDANATTSLSSTSAGYVFLERGGSALSSTTWYIMVMAIGPYS